MDSKRKSSVEVFAHDEGTRDDERKEEEKRRLDFFGVRLSRRLFA